MKATFVRNPETNMTEMVQIDDARITFRNFSGTPDAFTREGDRSFSLIIPNQEITDALMNDHNQYGVGWNVKIKPPKDVDDQPFMHLKVKVKFNGRGPAVYLKSGDNMRMLDEVTVGILDKIDIQSVDLDIRPYDDEGRWGPFRAAYLQSIHVTQKIDRFAARYASDDEDYPFDN